MSSTTAPTAPAAPAAPTVTTARRHGATVPPLTAQDVQLLQVVRDYPAVSVLMSTSAAARMNPADQATMDRLVAQATRRLEADGDPAATSVASALRELARSVRGEPTSAALALYAGSCTVRAVRLTVPVADRVVVDPTFATRDLVRSLHRTPRHAVLLLSNREARLLQGAGDTLLPAPSDTFPLRAPDRSGRAARPSDSAAFLRAVDRALGAHLARHPAPLVLAGGGRALAAFTRISGNVGRLAGTVPANLVDQPLDVLVSRVRPVLERYLQSREREALNHLERRSGAGRAVSGMTACWLAARRERPEMLAVDEGLFYPARLTDGGDGLEPATDVLAPDVLDDAVDELIELVLQRGGWVALVTDGTLADHDGVALTLRRR